MEIIIEQISKGHKLLNRYKFNQPNIQIGRGYHNDIIIDDPHVCAAHLNINYDGQQWLVTDNNTTNGSFIEKNQQQADQHIVSSGDIITLGKSQIRIFFPDHPIQESIAFNPFERFIELTSTPIAIAVNIMVFACIAAYMSYLGKAVDMTLSQLLVPAFSMTLVACIWPIIVAVISHLTKHESRIFSQIGTCFLFFNLMSISQFINMMFSFNLSSSWPIGVITSLLPVSLVFALLWLNCAIGFHMKNQKRMIISCSLTTLLFGGLLMVELSNQPEFSAIPHYNATVMTPEFLLRSGVTTQTFIEDSQPLFEQARQLATEE